MWSRIIRSSPLADFRDPASRVFLARTLLRPAQVRKNPKQFGFISSCAPSRNRSQVSACWPRPRPRLSRLRSLRPPIPTGAPRRQNPPDKNLSDFAVVLPVGIGPTSQDPQSRILSIELWERFCYLRAIFSHAITTIE